jgi:hypothetical protein
VFFSLPTARHTVDVVSSKNFLVFREVKLQIFGHWVHRSRRASVVAKRGRHVTCLSVGFHTPSAPRKVPNGPMMSLVNPMAASLLRQGPPANTLWSQVEVLRHPVIPMRRFPLLSHIPTGQWAPAHLPQRARVVILKASKNSHQGLRR